MVSAFWISPLNGQCQCTTIVIHLYANHLVNDPNKLHSSLNPISLNPDFLKPDCPKKKGHELVFWENWFKDLFHMYV